MRGLIRQKAGKCRHNAPSLGLPFASILVKLSLLRENLVRLLLQMRLLVFDNHLLLKYLTNDLLERFLYVSVSER